MKEKNINIKKKRKDGAALIVEPGTNINILLKEIIDKNKAKKRN